MMMTIHWIRHLKKKVVDEDDDFDGPLDDLGFERFDDDDDEDDDY